MTRPYRRTHPVNHVNRANQSLVWGQSAADRWAIVYRDDSAADREGEPDVWPKIERQLSRALVIIIVLGLSFSYESHRLKSARKQTQLTTFDFLKRANNEQWCP